MTTKQKRNASVFCIVSCLILFENFVFTEKTRSADLPLLNAKYSDMVFDPATGIDRGSDSLPVENGDAPALIADYRFQGSLNSSVPGAPAMRNLTFGQNVNVFVTDNVDGYSRQTLRFPLNNGIAIDNLAPVPTNALTMVVLFRLDQLAGRRRLLDFSGGSDPKNGGFYLDGRLEGENTSNTPALANAFVQLVLVRTGTGSLLSYRDGILRLTEPDGGSPLSGGLRFFQDFGSDPPLASAGNIARLRFYDAPLTLEQIHQLDRVPEAPTGAMPILFFSARNGTFEHYRMNPDGTSQRRLTNNEFTEFAARFSPDGQKIVYQRRESASAPQQIWTANSDGTNPVRLTNTTTNDISASWRPDGQKILFSRCTLPLCDLYTMNADGTDQQPIAAANTAGDEDQARFTPDGSKLVFMCADATPTNYQICVTNADGTNRQVITNTTAPLVSQQLDISPDGQKIAFVRNSTTINGIAGNDIYTMNIDGSNVVNITNNATSDSAPIWSPDGSKILFGAARAGGINDIWLMNANGSSPVRLMLNSFDDRPSDWFRPKTRRSPYDFDGDSKTDVSIFRPSDGSWWYLQSSDSQFKVYRFGVSTDVLAPGDFTGDGKADLAVFRSSTGDWFIQRSEDNSFFSFPFGASSDIPCPADFDGDGRTDAAVYRPSSGTWYILNSGGGTGIVNFGTAEDKPVPADFDGDGKADIAIFRPSDGSWWYLQSTNSQFKVYRFGVSTDKPVQGDYTGDGKADLAVFRPATGEWFVQRSEDNSYFSFIWGQAGDIPVPGDYDGDGKFDTSVFRPSNSTWFLNQTTSGVGIVTFGISGDKPVPNAFVP